MIEPANSNRAEDTIPGFREMLDNLTKLMADIPPPTVFASSTLFPADAAWHFKDGRREYICAGPAFWAQVPEAIREPQGNPFTLSAIEIVDIDAPRQRATRAQVLDALAAAFSPTESEPKCGNIDQVKG